MAAVGTLDDRLRALRGDRSAASAVLAPAFTPNPDSTNEPLSAPSFTNPAAATLPATQEGQPGVAPRVAGEAGPLGLGPGGRGGSPPGTAAPGRTPPGRNRVEIGFSAGAAHRAVESIVDDLNARAAKAGGGDPPLRAVPFEFIPAPVQTPADPADSPAMRAARANLATERAGGADVSSADLRDGFGLPFTTATRLLTEQERAERSARGRALSAGLHFSRTDDALRYHPATVAGAMAAVESAGGDPHAWLRDAVAEEQWHRRDLMAAGLGTPGGANVHETVWNALPENTRTTLARTHGELPAPAGFSPEQAAAYTRQALASEYLRMLAQCRAGGRVTESHFRNTTAIETALDAPQPATVEDHWRRMASLAE